MKTKRFLKYFSVSLVLVLCFSFAVLPVSAASNPAVQTYDSTFIEGLDSIETLFLADDDGNTFLIGPDARTGGLISNGTLFYVQSVLPSSVNGLYKTALVSFIPSDEFIYSIDKSKNYTFVFVGNTASSSINADSAAAALKDSNGNLVTTLAELNGGRPGYFIFTFSPEQLEHIDDIVSVQFQFRFESTVPSGYFRLNFLPYATVTVEDPELNAILNGWESDPKPPAAEEEFNEFFEREEAILENLDTPLEDAKDLIGNVAVNMDMFSAGFVIITGITNLILNNNQFLTLLISISLGLGIFIFLLGLAPSYASSLLHGINQYDRVTKGKIKKDNNKGGGS